MKPYKEKTIKITTEKQEQLLRDALKDNKKYSQEFGIKTVLPKKREEKIENINEIEKLEKQLDQQ